MNNNNGRCEQLLIGSQAIRDYLHGIADPLFKQLIKDGLPAVAINNRWYAWKSNIDQYFKERTRRGSREVLEDIE